MGRGSSDAVRPPRLSHKWILSRDSDISESLVREFIRPAVRAVPSSMARRLGPCGIALLAQAELNVASRWTTTTSALEVSVMTNELEEHNIAMELLVCLGQALWERPSVAELRAYWIILWDEINSGIEGEIDEQALDEKRSPLRKSVPREEYPPPGEVWLLLLRRDCGRVHCL
jgi:hypothetical protein